MSTPTNQPPTGSNDLPQNPIIQQQQPPLYLSLEELRKGATKVVDPAARQMIEAALSLQEATNKETAALKQNAFNDATRRRQDRVSRLLKRNPSPAFAQKVADLAKGAQLALGADGMVSDSLTPMLDALEAGIQDLPTLLTNPTAVAQAHPQQYDGEMSEERRQAVVAEMARNAGMAPAPAAATAK